MALSRLRRMRLSLRSSTSPPASSPASEPSPPSSSMEPSSPPSSAPLGAADDAGAAERARALGALAARSEAAAAGFLGGGLRVAPPGAIGAVIAEFADESMPLAAVAWPILCPVAAHCACCGVAVELGSKASSTLRISMDVSASPSPMTLGSPKGTSTAAPSAEPAEGSGDPATGPAVAAPSARSWGKSASGSRADWALCEVRTELRLAPSSSLVLASRK
mmetsp:Transcript_15542/g.41702  ORF Transcript_15542/g.41702 Transcript_15542/m.41702 type:complete len:220 (+) Transcript_15542:1771-2430(+)